MSVTIAKFGKLAGKVIQNVNGSWVESTLTIKVMSGESVIYEGLDIEWAEYVSNECTDAVICGEFVKAAFRKNSVSADKLYLWIAKRTPNRSKHQDYALWAGSGSKAGAEAYNHLYN